MRSSPNLVVGTLVVIDDTKVAEARLLLQDIVPDHVYRVEAVEVLPRETILPKAYIESGFMPEVVRKYCSMPRGLYTTNHDLMDSDCFVHVRGRKFSGAWFRPATASEVNRHAREIL